MSNTTTLTSLSVVVVPVGGPAFVRRCLTALLERQDSPIGEIIVTYDAQEMAYELLAPKFPVAVFMPVTFAPNRDQPSSPEFEYAARHVVYDTLKAQALSVCQGSVMALIEDTVIPDDDWSTQVLAAHHLPHAVIGGAVEHAGHGLLNWAVYFMDFGRYALPLAEGPQQSLTDINVSYKADVLNANGDLWRQRYHEVGLHVGLLKRGATLWLRPRMVVRQDRGPLVFREMLSERFQWGWVYGAKRAEMVGRLTRVVLVVFSPAIPLIRMARLALKVLAGKKDRLRFLVALPHLLSLTLAWSFGELYGYVRPTIRDTRPQLASRYLPPSPLKPATTEPERHEQ